MSPSAMPNGLANGHGVSNGHSNGNVNRQHADELGLSILGFGVEYPPHRVGPEALQILAERHYPKSPAYVRISSTTSVS